MTVVGEGGKYVLDRMLTPSVETASIQFNFSFFQKSTGLLNSVRWFLFSLKENASLHQAVPACWHTPRTTCGC
jgi:hypothetical protein